MEWVIALPDVSEICEVPMTEESRMWNEGYVISLLEKEQNSPCVCWCLWRRMCMIVCVYMCAYDIYHMHFKLLILGEDREREQLPVIKVPGIIGLLSCKLRRCLCMYVVNVGVCVCSEGCHLCCYLLRCWDLTSKMTDGKKSDDPSSILRLHVVERKSQFLNVVLWSPYWGFKQCPFTP